MMRWARARHLAPIEVENAVNLPVNQRRRLADPRVVAAAAFIIAAGAVALEIAYTIGRFAISTVEQIHS